MAVVAKKTERVGTGRLRWPALVLVVPVAAVLALAGLVVAADAAFADRALPHVTVAGVEVGTLPSAEVRDRLEREIAQPWAAAAVTVAGPDGRHWTTTNGALAIAPDLDRAVGDALAYGKSGAITERLGAWLDALRGTVTVPFAMRGDGHTAEAWAAEIAAAVDRGVIDGAIVATYEGIQVTEPVVGRQTDRSGLIAALLAPKTLADRDLQLIVREAWPAVDASGLRDAAARARAAIAAVDISAGERGIHENAAGLATLLTIEKVAAAGSELGPVPAGVTAPATRYTYRVTADEARVKAWIAAVADELDRPAVNATYAVRPDGSLAVVAARDGSRIDQAKLMSDITAALFVPSTATRVFTPTFVVEKPAFSTELAQRYVGGMVRTSSFTTYYPPNAARHANITTGALQFNNVVIAPGESFSFWDRLGPVTVERGYAYAGAIINNRSDENVIGGGLCQVSTTLFNAVARAGYEILERHEHGYYIDRYPIGFDAAVFLPGVDFRWRNDTPYPVLIRAFGYPASVAFELYSIPTGRRVVVGDAVESNLRNPSWDQPADDAYPPGATVQGRDVVRTRTVYEGDRVVHFDTFYSHYVPVWGGPAR